MASSKFGEPWFSRESMAPELETQVVKHSSGRRVFYGESGEDLRLKQPGFKWSLLSDKRHQILDEFTQQFTGIFDEFYEKITGQDRRSRRKSSIAPILPSLKTPGLSRHKSRMAPIPESEDTLPIQAPPPQIDHQKFTTPEPQQPSTCSEPKPEQPANVPMELSTDVPTKTDIPKKAKATRGRKKVPKVAVNESQSSDEEFVPDRRPTRRLTRQQARTANRNPEPTPSVRTRRTRACKTGNRKPPDEETKIEARSPVPLRSSMVGVDSKEVIKVTNNRFSRELSVARISRSSICRVSIEKISLSPTAPPDTVAKDNIRSVTTPTPTVADSNTDSTPMECQPGGSEHISATMPSTSKKVTNSNTNLPRSPETTVIVNGGGNGTDTADSEDKENAPPLQPTPLGPSEPEGDVEMSLARPTPPRRKALKLRKKGVKRPVGKPRTRAAELREKSVARTPTADVAGNPTLTNNPGTTTPVHPKPSPTVPPSSSADSVYESCVSELGTPNDLADIPSHKATPSPTPHIEYKTPPTITKPTGAIEQEDPIPPARGEQVDHNSADCESEDAMSSPPPPTATEAPSIDAPSYLTGTPRTLLKLREEYQNRTRGKVVSLTDLLNSGGRTGSPLKKKTSKIAKTPKKATLSNDSPAPSKPVSMATNCTPLYLSTHTKAVSKAPGLTAIAEPAPTEGDPGAAETPVLERTLTKETVTPFLRGKRLRSVSVERLTEWSGGESHKSRKRMSSSEESEGRTEGEGGTDSPTGTETTDDIGSESGTESTPSIYTYKKVNKSRTFLSGLGKKRMMEGALQFKEGTNQPLSFLPRKSPKKMETLEEKKAHLADKIHRKRQEEERRAEGLKNRRQQELQEKIKKREERARKVAEKQAALRQKEEEKKQRLKGQQGQDPAKKITIKKAKEIEEKNKKLKERVMAVEARRKQEELQQQKRLHQLEEEKRMALELAHRRKEMEEEEKRLKRQEKLKQDRERHLKHMEELRGQQEELKRKVEEELQKKPPAEALKKSSNENVTSSKHNELMKQFEKLMGGAIAKVPVVATPKITRVFTGNSGNSSSEKTNKLLQAYYNGSQPQTSGQPARPSSSVLSPADSRLNSTFTKDSPSTLKSPLSSQTVPTSYQMTPADKDPLYGYDNYDIDNLSSEDSTDDEEHPKKVLPLWAWPESLSLVMRSQEDDLTRNILDVHKIFPPEQLLKDPDLGKIFRRKRQRFYQRSSSARWDSPILKRNKVVHV